MRRIVSLAAVYCLAFIGAEGAIRALRPGYPGFRIPQVQHRTAPGLGFEMVPNQIAYTTAEPATINEHGFRGPRFRGHRRADHVRVLCIGDSMTFGYSVGDDDPFPRQLERRLSEVWPGRQAEVINAGVQRYFLYQVIDLLRVKGPPLAPDVVVLAVNGSDPGTRQSEGYTREFEKEEEQAAGAFSRRFPALYLLAKNSALVEMTKNGYLLARQRSVSLNSFNGVASARDERRWAAMEQEIGALRELSDAHGFFPLLVAIPARIQIQRTFPNSLYPKRVYALAQQHGIDTVDLVAAFRSSLQRGDDPYLPWNNHLSGHGHALVANALGSRLRKEFPNGHTRLMTAR